MRPFIAPLPRIAVPAWGLVALALGSCKVDLAAVGQAPADIAQAPAALPPPAPGPNGEKVYQILYAGEFGVQARAAGQRARMLAWMDAVGFSKEQLDGLLYLTSTVRAAEARDAAALATLGVAEGRSLQPIYQDLVDQYANGGTATEAQLTPYASRLEAADKDAYGGTDPRGAHYAAVTRALELVNKWVANVPEAQKAKLGECRFFLQRKLGPFTNPGDYEKWLGTAWNGADFASLRAGGRPVDEGQMDIGGLWTDDASADQSLPGLRVAVLVLFAIEEDGFPSAVQVRMGTRNPDDYTGDGSILPVPAASALPPPADPGARRGSRQDLR